MKLNLTTLLPTSLVVIAFATLSGCGLKGPLVLEQVPIEKTQAPFENSIDPIPVETPTQENSEASSETAEVTEPE